MSVSVYIKLDSIFSFIEHFHYYWLSIIDTFSHFWFLLLGKVLQSLGMGMPMESIFLLFKKISRDSVVTDSEGYNGFPQINIPFKFSRINHRPLVLMDGCSKCCEINTVSSTCGSLQVLTWNNDSIIEKMDGWKWCHHITDFFQYMHAWNQGCIKFIIYDISLLQFLFCKSATNLKECVAAIALL